MNIRMDRWESQIAYKLARGFGHGWADFVDGASDWDAVRHAMGVWEAANGLSAGLGPSLSHVSGGGRFRWEISPDVAVVEVRRIDGVVLTIYVERGRDGFRTVLGSIGGYVRHAEAGGWVISALFGAERGERFFTGLVGPIRAAIVRANRARLVEVSEQMYRVGYDDAALAAEHLRLVEQMAQIEAYRLW